MPLVTANQYDLVPQFTNLGTGFAQGQQIANQFRQQKLQDEQLGLERQKQQTISQFTPQALAGDQEAFTKIAQADPIVAQQLQQIFANKTEMEVAEDLRENKVLTQVALNAKQLPADKRRAYLMQKEEELRAAGRDTSNIKRALAGDEQQMNQLLDTQAIQGFALDKQASILFPEIARTAEEKAFETLTANLSQQDKEKAKRIKLGLDPRAGISAEERIAQDKGLSTQVAQAEAEKAGAVEEAKLIKQKQLKPEVEAAVISAVSNAKAQAESVAEGRSNAKAQNLYDTAMSGLVSALSDTATGPFVGWTPALTANQQIAEGAIAAMAPVLKQLFRGAGEGTFTDKDQELLLQMVPTRSDTKEAIAAKLANIDAIVRAKLGQPSAQTQQAQPAQPATQPQAPTSRFIIEVVE